MQSPLFLSKSDQITQGWLPITNPTEQAIVDYLDNLGINQLIMVEKPQTSTTRLSLRSLDNLGSPNLHRVLSLNFDSDLIHRRASRLSSDQI
ncbi:hypothetical protein pb186bvf_017023 [Paramecium bursaria]